MLTDKQCKAIWEDPSKKVNINTPEGIQVMQWVEKELKKSVSNKPCFDIKSGIN